MPKARPAARPRALGVEPGGHRAVGLLPGRVALEQLANQRRPLGVGDGEAGVGVAHVAPGELAEEVALAGLLAQAGAGPEGERDRVVLVEHLVDRLGEEGRGIGRVLAHRLGDRDDADAEPLAQQLLVAAGLDLVSGEAGGVVDEDDVEALLGGVGHQPLELRPGVGLAPAGVEVGVLLAEVETVLGGELADLLALGIGREALALLLGRLADVGDRAWQRCLSALRSPLCLPRRSHQSQNQRANASISGWIGGLLP